MEKSFSISNAISTGWQATKKDWLVFVGLFLAVMVISMLISVPELIFKNPVITAISYVISFIFSAICSAGLTKLYIESAKGNEIDFQQFKDSIGRALFMFIASLAYCVAVIVGTCFFIIPGIMLAMRFSMVTFIIIDQPELSIIDAFKESWKMTKNHGTQIFVLCLYAIGITILGIICLFVGVFFAMVCYTLTFAAAYIQLKHDQKDREVYQDGVVNYQV